MKIETILLSLKEAERFATVIVVTDVVPVCFPKPIFLQEAPVELAYGSCLQPFRSLNNVNHNPHSREECGHHKRAQQGRRKGLSSFPSVTSMRTPDIRRAAAHQFDVLRRFLIDIPAEGVPKPATAVLPIPASPAPVFNASKSRNLPLVPDQAARGAD